ncbi:MAG: endonuclease domain-containing protein [Polyangiaceae bacterium]
MGWRAGRGQWELEKALAMEMRRAPTAGEREMWELLRRRKLHGLRFRRQVVIDRFIVDFSCPQLRLVVQVDGPIHQERRERDAGRTRALEALGLLVLRFSNDEVLDEGDSVVERILRVVLP